MNRQSANTNSAVDSTRCQHRTPYGRRCKMPVVSQGQRLCGTHTQELIKADGLNLREALLLNSQGLQTAQGINLALGNIFKLLAANYISARRAAVLTSICAQLLRTLPAIDADNAAGIADPTAPKPTPPEPPSFTTSPAQSTGQPAAARTKPASPTVASDTANSSPARAFSAMNPGCALPSPAQVIPTPPASSIAKQTVPPAAEAQSSAAAPCSTPVGPPC